MLIPAKIMSKSFHGIVLSYNVDTTHSAIYEIERTLTFEDYDLIPDIVLRGEFDGQEIPYNSIGMAYPNISPSGWHGLKVPFPDDGRSFVFCGTGSTEPSCVSRNSDYQVFRNATAASYGFRGFDVPSNAGTSYEAHHIHSLCWNGDEDGNNGVFLTNRTSGGEHQRFTTWWRYFLTGCPNYGTLPNVYPLQPQE